MLRLVAFSIAILLGAVILYEGIALVRAKQRTPAVLAQAGAGKLKLSNVPPRRIAMLLKVNDPNFYGHRGVDFSTPGTGMTTITQSLVKRFCFTHFTKGFPKIEQTLIARFVLDPAMPKDRQLEAFINFANLGDLGGRPVTGFDEAARTYFTRSLDRITDREYLSLVAMLNAPSELDPIRHAAANAARVRRIEAMLAGKCKPTGLRDVNYEACAPFVS